MALFVIGDLHLSFGVKKPMDVFRGWENYTQLLQDNWLKLIGEDDTVVIPGDFSWGINLEEARADFAFLASLPGRKILLKGNHDYWWSTNRKNVEFTEKFHNIFFLQNQHFVYEDTAICGARSWFFEDTGKYSEKVAKRENIRLELSLKSAEDAGITEKIVFLHFPPIYKDKKCEDIIEVMRKFGVKKCFYGHLHGDAISGAFNGDEDGIDFRLISADYLGFIPHRIR